MKTRAQLAEAWNKIKSTEITLEVDGIKLNYLPLPSEDDVDENISFIKEMASMRDENEEVNFDKTQLSQYLSRLLIRKQQLTLKDVVFEAIGHIKTVTIPDVLNSLLKNKSNTMSKLKMNAIASRLSNWKFSLEKHYNNFSTAVEELRCISDDREWPVDITLTEMLENDQLNYAEPVYTWAVFGNNFVDEVTLGKLEEHVIATCLIDEIEDTENQAMQLLATSSKCKEIIDSLKMEQECQSMNVHHSREKLQEDDAVIKQRSLKEILKETNQSHTCDEVCSVVSDAAESSHFQDNNSSIGTDALNLLPEDVQRLTRNVRGVVKSLRRCKDQVETDQDLLCDKLFRNSIIRINDEVTQCELEINRLEETPDEANKWLQESLTLVNILSRKCREADDVYKKTEHNKKETELSSKNIAEFNGNYGNYITWRRQVIETLKSSNKPKRLWKMIVSNSCFKSATGGALIMINRAITETTDWDEFIDELDSYFGEPSMVANFMGKRIGKLRGPSGNGDPLAIEMLKSILAINTDLEASDIKEMVIQKGIVEDVFDKLPPVVKDYVSERKYQKKPVEIWNIIIEGFKCKKYYLMANRDTYYTLSKGKLGDSKEQENKKINGAITRMKVSKTSKEPVPSDTSKTFEPCYLCDESHAVWSYTCQMTGKNLTPETIKRLIDLKVCLRCGRKSEDCNEKCNGKYRTKDGRIKVSDCSMCKSKVHFRLCKCNYEENKKCDTKAKCAQVTKTFNGDSIAQVEKVEIIDPESHASFVANIQYDSGSQRSWIQANFELCGEFVKSEHLNVQGFASTVLDEKDFDVFSYLINVQGLKKRIELTKYEGLTGVPEGRVQIPGEWREKFKSNNYRVEGERVDILLGADYQGLHPIQLETKGNLVLFESNITRNYLIGGSNRKLETVICKPVKILTDNEKHKMFMEMLTCESLEFTEKRDQLQMKKEDQDLYASLEHKDGRWYANYHYYDKLKDLCENRSSVERMMGTLLAKLKKRPDLKSQVIKQIEGNLERHHWVPVADLHLNGSLQKHYLPWNVVINEKSQSTPVRLVTNSSNKDRNGLSLNDCQVQGSSDIGDLRKVLIALRSSQNIAIGDLSKYFNSFKLPDADISLRRLLIPEMLVPQGWKNFIAPEDKFMEVVEASMPFGDSAAAWLAVLGRIKNAEMFSHLVERFQDRILTIYLHQSYVDDCVISGKWNEDLEPLLRGMKTVAEAGGFKFKEFHNVGDDKSEKTLGYLWNSKDDSLMLKNWFNLGKKDRGKKLDEDLTPETVTSKVMSSFTKRDAISCQAQIFDPLGLYLPMTIKLRLLYGEACLRHPGQAKESWNTELDDDLKKKFVRIFMDLWKAKEVTFPRTTIPRNVIQGEKVKVTLATFCDGGEKAYAACVYLVTTTDDGPASHLLTAMGKTSGTKRLSIPRIELLGAELGVKLWKKTKDNLPNEIEVKESKFFTDSTTVLRQLKCHSGSFNVFVGTRVECIQSETNIADWRHIPSEQNAADLATKDKATVADLTSLKWMNGHFLMTPEDVWPGSPMDNLPGSLEPLPDLAKGYSTANEIVRTNKILVKKISESKVSNEEESKAELVRSIAVNAKSWDAALKTCAILLKAVEKFKSSIKQDENFKFTPAPLRFLLAKKMLLHSTMPDTRKMLKTSKISSHQITESDDKIIYAVGRTMESIGEKRVPLVNGASVVGALILKQWHNMWGHGRSVRRVESKLREKFLIPFSRKRLEKLRNECFTCKKLDAKSLPQKMGPLPESRSNFKKPFHSIQVDIAGPFPVRDAVKRRVVLKHWLICATCESTRATFACAMEDYGAASVLRALQNLKSQHGNFKFVHSDLGSNLVKAGKVIEAQFQEVKKAVTGNYPDVEWSFGPGKAPWVQGTVEAIIKLLKVEKKREQLITGQKILTSLQFDQVVRGWANTVNQRPLIYNPEIGQALTPNHLLHGRSDEEQDNEPEVSGKLLERYRDVQDQMKRWWELYNESVRRDRVQKWRKEKENLKAGDIVWLLDTPSRTGFYKLGRIVQTSPSSDGLVRRATVRYFNAFEKRCRAETVERHVNTMVLVARPDEEMDTIEQEH